MMPKNWKTIIAGSLYPLGKMVQQITEGPRWLYYLGQAMEIVAVFGLGMAAKDFDRTGVDNDKIKP